MRIKHSLSTLEVTWLTLGIAHINTNYIAYVFGASCHL